MSVSFVLPSPTFSTPTLLPLTVLLVLSMLAASEERTLAQFLVTGDQTSTLSPSSPASTLLLVSALSTQLLTLTLLSNTKPRAPVLPTMKVSSALSVKEASLVTLNLNARGVLPFQSTFSSVL